MGTDQAEATWYRCFDVDHCAFHVCSSPGRPSSNMPVSLGAWPRFQYFNQLDGKQERRNRTVQVRCCALGLPSLGLPLTPPYLLVVELHRCVDISSLLDHSYTMFHHRVPKKKIQMRSQVPLWTLQLTEGGPPLRRASACPV